MVEKEDCDRRDMNENRGGQTVRVGMKSTRRRNEGQRISQLLYSQWFPFLGLRPLSYLSTIIVSVKRVCPSPYTTFFRFPRGGFLLGLMLTLAPASYCDVCAEEYGAQCLPHSIPCGESLENFIALGKKSEHLFVD